MSGAYVAKSGINYSILVTGPVSMNFDASAAITGSFRLDENRRTPRPEPFTVTWTATLDGNQQDLRDGSTGSFESSIETAVADSGTYWEASPSLEFGLSVAFADRTLIVTGAGVVGGVAVNDTASITVPGWPNIDYTYTIDLEDVFWVSGNYQWEFRCEIAVRKRSDTSVWYFLRKYIRQIRSQDGGAIEQGIIAETNPENDPGDITLTLSVTASEFGDPPNYYEDSVESILNITVDEQDPLMYYICKGEVIIGRTSTGTNIVTHTMDLTTIAGVQLDTDTQTGTYTQGSSWGSLRATGDVISRETWQL